MRFLGMSIHTFDTILYRIDPLRNMCRYYSISIMPNLFGGHSLMRTWGRRGSGGQTIIELFDNPATAQVACDRILRSKLKRGYSECRLSH